MEYAMLTTLIPREYEAEFRKNSRRVMQDAANALQWHLYNGLCTNLDKFTPVFNILPVGSFPQYYNRPFIKSYPFDDKGKNIGYCNIKLIRNKSKAKKIYRELYKWCASTEDEKTLFVYTISQPFMSAVSRLKKRFCDLHVCSIIADLPDMSNLSSRKSLLLKLFSANKAKESYSLISSVDSFVLLTKYMADYMKLKQPYCVMEGIATNQNDFTEPNYEGKLKTVFYAGTLHRKFGVLNLLEAFKNIKSEDYRLVICGVGDSEKEIMEASQKDSRIKFHGCLPREEVLKLQSSATVLVNPRQNNEEFTKYSFPSKNLEYLSSGIPFIAYKLDGIPDEYDEYILYVKDNDMPSLSNKIKEVCEKTSQERKLIGTKARMFVNEYKNDVVQTKRILFFVRKFD